MLSIIIPTLNEEHYLPQLLDSIQKQGFRDYQIIIADAGSKDTTVQIAKKYHCLMAGGGSPAEGRNYGAKMAKGDTLFFLDADTLLSDNFLNASLQEFAARKLEVASFCLQPHPKNSFEKFLLNVFYNFTIIVSEKLLPHTAVGIIIKKELFDRLGGYDETIKLAEDHDLGRRAAKHGKFGIIKSVTLLFSTRRFKQEGWIKVGIKYFLCELYMVFIGPVKSDIFKYKFNHYKEDKS